MQGQVNPRWMKAMLDGCEGNFKRNGKQLSYKEKVKKSEKKRRKEVAKKRKRVDVESDLYESDTDKSDAIIITDKKSVANSSMSEKETATVPQNPEKGLPSLYQCAELLKERVHLITYSDSLYYYNGKCYDIAKETDIISLYRSKVDNRVGNEKSLNAINQLLKFLSTDSTIAVKEVRNNKRIAVLRNGIYDVEKEKLKPHTYKEIVFSYVNADYVEGEDCPCFDAFLNDVTEKRYILKERLWMFLGYVLMQTTEAKVFFVMGEAPDSGKSVLGKFIEDLYPKKYVSNIALTDFNKSFSVAPIAGSAVNISLDLPASRLNAVAVSKLKMLTGGDTFNINQKYVPEFRYENRAKLIFASNFPICLMEEDDAFWNRLIYLPFNKSIPKAQQNRDLPEMFRKEKNAIVSKALYYAHKLVLSGFQFPSLIEIDRKMQEWQGRRCATIENFLSDCCVIGERYKGEFMNDLYLAYENYCENAGYVAKSRNMFKNFLEEQMGLTHCKTRGESEINPRSAFRGIKLLD